MAAFPDSTAVSNLTLISSVSHVFFSALNADPGFKEFIREETLPDPCRRGDLMSALSSDWDARIARAREMALLEHEKVLKRKNSGLTGDSSSHTFEPLVSTTPLCFSNLPNIAILNRIYVGSIQFEVTEKELHNIFGVFGTIRSLNMMMDPVAKRHKGYGFVEFETPEAASLAQDNMDGAELAGRQIKVGRPTNFPSDLPPGIPKPLPGRIYVSNVHPLIQEGELQAIFEAFGPLLHCNLVPDQKTRQHRGFAYVEFKEGKDAQAAIQALHGFELAARPLKVGPTIVGGVIPPGMDSLNEPSQPSKPRVPSAVLRAAQQINQAIAGSEPSLQPSTAAILLCNVEDPAAFDAKSDPNGELRKELEIDIGEECARFGKVLRCSVEVEEGEARCFILFENPAQAQQAILIMNGRWFGGRQLTAFTVPEDYCCK